ncbi:hypothetical protein [Nocardioides sp. SYSU DS0651]|uniref:hypothetical protein n=1 Tax=Nocardioides sp. SYSU DS0651 TaxID=3415955 RepID=UPI003F4B99A7
MSTPLRVGGFVVALVAVLGIAVGVGRAVGPVDEPEPADHGEDHGAAGGTGHGDGDAAPAADSVPAGLMTSQGGYTLALADPHARAGQDVPVRFTITGPDGRPVTEFDVEHEKRLHLIAVRRDHTGFQHVHPQMRGDGTWSTRLDLTPGSWRLFADFRATGAEALTLGADLAVPGDHAPVAPAPVSRTAQVDGYTVTLDGDLAAGGDARLTLSVSRDGRPVTDLQPYLGAYGHLVALREGDLAYLHVHPDGTPGDGSTHPGPDVVFHATVPSEGRYRLYLDFKHEGVVRTAAFTVAAGDQPGAQPTASPSGPDDQGDGPGDEHGDDHGH